MAISKICHGSGIVARIRLCGSFVDDALDVIWSESHKGLPPTFPQSYAWDAARCCGVIDRGGFQSKDAADFLGREKVFLFVWGHDVNLRW